jgi:hypothetical protein
MMLRRLREEVKLMPRETQTQLEGGLTEQKERPLSNRLLRRRHADFRESAMRL